MHRMQTDFLLMNLAKIEWSKIYLKETRMHANISCIFMTLSVCSGLGIKSLLEKYYIVLI